MLVARKYDLPEYDIHPRVRQHNNGLTKKKKVSKSKANNVGRIVFTIILFFVLEFFVILRHVNLTEMSNNVDQQKKYISSLEKVNSQLRTETVVDLAKVDEIAKNKLNMDRPYKFQMVYVNLHENTSSDNIETINEGSEYKIVRSLNKVVGLF